MSNYKNDVQHISHRRRLRWIYPIVLFIYFFFLLVFVILLKKSLFLLVVLQSFCMHWFLFPYSLLLLSLLYFCMLQPASFTKSVQKHLTWTLWTFPLLAGFLLSIQIYLHPVQFHLLYKFYFRFHLIENQEKNTGW